MKLAVNSLLSLLDVGTGFCYWLLGRDLLDEEVKKIQDLFRRVLKPEDEHILIDTLRSLSPGKDLLLVCDSNNHNLVQWCILRNYTQALLVLLEYGCNPTRSGLPDYDLPLALACCLGQREIIRHLLEHGAVPSQTTMLSENTLDILCQNETHERHVKLLGLLKYRTNISSLSIVLTFDDLMIFRLLMGETDPTIVSSSMHSIMINDDQQSRTADHDSDIIRDNFKLEQIHEPCLTHVTEDCMDKQQSSQQIGIIHDDLSDYAEHGPLFSFCDTLDVESAVINQDDCNQAFFDKGNQVERNHEDETCAIGATTDGGYCTVDGSSERVKSQPTIPNADVQALLENSIHQPKLNPCSTDIENTCRTRLLNTLSVNINDTKNEFYSTRSRSTSSSLLSNMSNSNKHTTQLLRLLHQMIECEAANILDYFLKQHRDEFNEHFHSTVRSSDIQLKTYELLSNIKSDRIYKVLCSSNCAYFSTVTTSLCDRENNTLVHSLLSQNPLKYQPKEMIKMLERYMSCGLNEFINRPNLSNHCMIQILLCNEHFLKMIFFRRQYPSTSKYLTINAQAYVEFLPFYDDELVEKWAQAYLMLIRILVKYGARIDMPAGCYRNSLDGLLSSLIDISKQLITIPLVFDVKYLKTLISLLLSSSMNSNTSKTRSIYFKYNIERFIQLLGLIHVQNEDLSEILIVTQQLIYHECIPLKLNTNTLMYLFKTWLTNPTFLCSSLLGKNLFMQQFLTIIIRRLNQSVSSTQSNIDHPLILTTSNNLPRRSLTSIDNDVCLQSVFLMLMNLISISPTCLQTQSISELIIIFINHTSIDTINSEHFQLPPIIYLCSQVKIVHSSLLFPLIDLFIMTQTYEMIEKSKDILSQMSNKRLSLDLYKYFLSSERNKPMARSLRHLTIRHLYHHLKRPFIDSVKRLPIGDALKQRLIHFDEI